MIVSGAEILEGFSHFVDHDSKNDYRLDMDEVIRSISRATDQVVEQEEVKVSSLTTGWILDLATFHVFSVIPMSHDVSNQS